MTPLIPVSCGELIDKLTILQIKIERLESPGALANVRRELAALRQVAVPLPASVELDRLTGALLAVNRQLWDVEDSLRDKEARQLFDAAFVEQARAVYRLNDERARIKREINRLLGSDLVEEKQYGCQ